MITSLKVNGFKSLTNFVIEFTKGLNVIIGPNGVGKTNICQALTLLSSLPSHSITETLYSMGGAAAVFNIESTKKKKIEMTVEGNIITEFQGKTTEEFDIKYVYDVSISLKRNHRIQILEKLMITRRVDNVYLKIIEVKHEKKSLRYNIINDELIGDFRIPEKKLNLRIEEDEDIWRLMPHISFVCHSVGRDLYRIKGINIDPYIAREACDIVEPDIMSSNGKYLANALYNVSRHKESFEEITSIINDSLTYKGVIKSEVSNILLKRYFSFVMEDGQKIPSNCLSDGTIKLLGLLVGIYDQDKYTMIIEEPENFLHPNVKSILINYLRETFDEGVCILTSHSETILNLLSPKELIICSNDNGTTICKRLDNVEKILESLENSGFGCGFHYVAGNLNI